MLNLYRTPSSALADELEESLREMNFAHRTVVVQSELDLPDDTELTSEDLPAFIDDGEAVTGEEALRDHLEQLHELRAGWYRFQSDTCELDEEGNVC